MNCIIKIPICATSSDYEIDGENISEECFGYVNNGQYGNFNHQNINLSGFYARNPWASSRCVS